MEGCGLQVNLEEVFKINGVPTHTFVQPQRYTQLLVALRSPRRGVVIEGPSGIGKTTAVRKALEQLRMHDRVQAFSARRPQDLEYIELSIEASDAGTIVIDDFHKLAEGLRSKLADRMKELADDESDETKLIVLGINQAGDNLIKFAPDLVNRIDVIRFESEPQENVRRLISQGEGALNIRINIANEIVAEASGSFYLAQLLSHECCIEGRVLESQDEVVPLQVSFETVRNSVMDRLEKTFAEPVKEFCVGSKIRKERRAPYLHILKWLAESNNWTLDLRSEVRRHSNLRGSVSQVVDKGFLGHLIEEKPRLSDVIHYEGSSRQITIEDPQFFFYIRNIPWRKLARDLGYVSVDFERRYDFALSFAGSDRDCAQALFEYLSAHELEVFYDRNEQHRIVANDVERYLEPIYKTEAEYVVVLLGVDYPKKVWTKFESQAFKDRFGEGAVIPVWISPVEPGAFDVTGAVGGFFLDKGEAVVPQIEQIGSTLLSKLEDGRE